ncbi:MAG: nucleotidyltransferase [Bacilli bacterium]
MHIIGLIAEYNPFHNGHLYQINKIKEMYPNSIIIAVVSSCFTQRGDVSVLNKWDKTQIALDNNIDIVIELPFVYATQGSDIFAKGAITILEKMKIDTLVFGTESDNLDIINLIADTQINNPNYNIIVKKYLNKGINYPTATNKAVNDLTGYKIDTPNDLLALSYIKQIKLDKQNIKIVNIKRTNSYHDKKIKNNIASASTIRKLNLNNKNIDNLIPYNPNCLYKISMNDYYPYLKYKVIEEELNLNKYQTVDEGIENRLINNINKSFNYDELISKIKTKRYTYNKISRMLLHILVDFTKESAKDLEVDYIRLLGFSTNGKKYLNKIKKSIDVPLITGYKKNISKILDIELKITKIYSLVTNSNLINKEYRNKPIIK